MSSQIVLGIDTGGTYTDAVLLDQSQGQVLAAAKAFTTYQNLALGIEEAVKTLPSDLLHSTEMVGLSTTLATNAIVEKKGRPISLFLIGYDRKLIDGYGLWGSLATEDVVFLAGGHDLDGCEQAPLDMETARSAVLSRSEHVDAFAVSGYCSVRNPGHELEVKRLIRELTGKPVTCGHELSVQYDSIRRATTAALNARLIPLLCDLIAGTRRALATFGIHAPLMVVRADGSLMRAELAMERPVETILSGPAASAVGAAFLTRLEKAYVVDVGGTTSDIIRLEEGRPRLSAGGAEIGDWRTTVHAVDVRTVGIGGDSRIVVDHNRRLHIGPRRSVPVSLLAASQPSVIRDLARQTGQEQSEGLGEFITLNNCNGTCGTYGEVENALLEAIRERARSRIGLQPDVAPSYLLERAVEHLESLGLVGRAGFTPTDALHVLGRFVPWNADAAKLVAELLGRRAGMAAEDFCNMVVEGVGDRICLEILFKILSDEEGLREKSECAWTGALMQRALGNSCATDLDCKLVLKSPLVAIGAPVAAYMPRVAEALHTQLVIPEYAHVANAVGAVVGSVVQVVEGTISPLDGTSKYRLHLGGEITVFEDLEKAVATARVRGEEIARSRAFAAGAKDVAVKMSRHDNNAHVAAGWGQDLYLGTDLSFTAVGRPSPTAS